MTDWISVQGSQQEKPSEWDTTSSASTVYQRRNIVAVEVPQQDGSTVTLWGYEERTMSANEALTVQFEQNTENQLAIMEALADIYVEQVGGSQ